MVCRGPQLCQLHSRPGRRRTRQEFKTFGAATRTAPPPHSPTAVAAPHTHREPLKQGLAALLAAVVTTLCTSGPVLAEVLAPVSHGAWGAWGGGVRLLAHE
jgi:hypothetical protein